MINALIRPLGTARVWRLGGLGALAIAVMWALFAASAARAQDTYISYPENGTDPVATFVATDQDGDAIVWSLGGDDADDFTIDGGVLSFKSPPNYEDPKSASTGTRADRNVYNVTVQAAGGSHRVAVTVTDVDEGGTVSFGGLGRFQPQAGRTLEATLADEDGGLTDENWQWARSSDGETWEDIEGATSQSRDPTVDDVGNWLRASVTYADSFGSGKVASAVTANRVEARTLSNAPPSFADQDDRFDDPTTTDTTENEGIQVNRTVAENTVAGSSIGRPVSATDADSDILVYSLLDGGTDADNDGVVDTHADDDSDANTPANRDGDSTKFSIDPASGQLKVKAALNFEAPGSAANSNVYSVTVVATDPSGASETELVDITVTDANEAPVFDSAPDAGIQDPPTVLNITENDANNQLRVGATGGDNLTTVAYDADDFDVDLTVTGASDADNEADAALSLAGPDAKYFEITDAGALTIVDDDTATTDVDESHSPNYETKSSYSITVVARSGTGDRTMRTMVDVTVRVIDAEDPGRVDLSQREPQVGQTVVAIVSDPDGGVHTTMWTWQTADELGDGTCPDATGSWTDIPNVSSAAYTPVAADVDNCLRATPTYTDNIGDAAEDPAPTAITERGVQASDPANTAPKFPDQDLVAIGDQSDETSRSVAENEPVGTTVGAPVTATDTDLLLYALGGADSAAFEVDNNGLIKTKVRLDYETQNTYMVYVMATDPSGASDSIIVNISVTDANDPADIVGSTAIDYAENGTNPVATFTATDQDGDAIEWSLGGADAADFSIDSGVLSFKKSPNYEDPQSASTGTRADRNVYNVTVQATGGELKVVVTVTNVDEDGKVTFDKPQPQAGRGLQASLSDPDMGESNQAWQWARSTDGETWTDIMGATAQSRNPSAEDVGSWLRATVTYSDVFGGGKTASAVTDNRVEARTVANAKPSFAGQDETTGAQAEDPNIIVVNRSVDENTASGTSIGKSVSATDADSDVLIYTLTGVDASSFDINSATGQLRTRAALNFEAPGSAATSNAYTVMVTATDPSGAHDTVTVTINVMDVNEAPTFTAGNNVLTAVNVLENTRDLRQGADGSTALTGTDFAATDVDATETATPTLTLEGPDADSFDISQAGALSLDDTDGPDADSDPDLVPNFEDKSSYSITIVATSGTGERLLRTRLDVTVHVLDREDAGRVSLSQREPQVGQTVVATVSDPDGGVTITSWAWATQAEDGNGNCPDAETGTWDAIDGVTSAAYTPVAGDVNTCLRATPTYTDNIGEAAETPAPMGTTERGVQASDPANTAPRFPDQDLVTVGDQSDEATRSVAENRNPGETVGNPLEAVDADLLMYNLSGPDAASFKVDTSGQITTAVKLDYEAQSVHTVVLTAVDPSGARDSILVTINVIDVDDGAVIVAQSLVVNGQASVGYDENGTGHVATYEAVGSQAGSVTWSRSGADMGSFTINGGVLAFSNSPDFENPGDADGDNVYEVTVTASDGTTTASVDVTVTVANVDEPGSVTLSAEQPVVGEELVATLADGDGVVTMEWQWAQEQADGTYADISGATSNAYTPVAEDDGKHLRVSVTYTDGFGSQVTLSATSVEMTSMTAALPYDANGDGQIDRNEAVQAVNDYLFEQTLTREEAIEVVNLYLFG